MFNSEYSKLKFILSKMIVAMEPKLIKNDNENNVYRENYIEMEKIANSSFGSVYKVYHKFEESYYAMKKIFITEELLNLNYNFFKEIQIFSKLYHPNIVRYYTSFIILDESSINDFNDERYDIDSTSVDNVNENSDMEEFINNTTSILFIQMELCDYTFREYIDNYKKDDCELKILNYFLEILNGLQYLHSLNIIHRDIKPTNIYMLNNIIKIGDFGLSTACINKNEEILRSSDIGVDFYRAPEIETGYYNEKIDIYGCGKILLELLITTTTQFEKYKNIKTIVYNNDHDISNTGYIDIKYNIIIKKALDVNIVNRYNINEFIYDIKTVMMTIY